jgi:DNA-binding Lrp family transcriptional regulator
MAANAYVLINVEPARTQEVIDRLNGISGAAVREVLGPYDVVVELEAGTAEDLTAIMRHQIRPIRGVNNTVTCLWFTNI